MIGERLKSARQKAGHTQESLAELLQVGEKNIWRYENEVTEPDTVMGARIAEALGVSLDFLTGLSDDSSGIIRESDLSPSERSVVTAWRLGKKLEAIRMIVGEDG